MVFVWKLGRGTDLLYSQLGFSDCAVENGAVYLVDFDFFPFDCVLADITRGVYQLANVDLVIFFCNETN